MNLARKTQCSRKTYLQIANQNRKPRRRWHVIGANDHLATVKDIRTLTTTYTWNGLDEATGIASPDTGTTYARTIDQDGRISVITISGTSGVPASTTLTYTLDNSNRVTNLAETGLTAKTFGYDYINRLTSFNPGTSISYSYDASSNRTAAGSTTYTMSTTSNRLASLSTGTTYSYDADGHMTGDGTHTWTYDQRGRLTSSTTGGVTTTYGVNGLGQRVTKAGSGVPSGGTNEFVYDGAGHLIGEYGSTGTIIEETVYLGDMPVAVMTSGGNYQVDPDNINAPHIITNQTGNRVWFWDHLDFGNNAPNQNPSGLGVFPYNLRFPGQYADAETGLNYNMFRDYNPTLGRYIQSDPIGLAAGVNTYGYVMGNPVTNVDPTGTSLVSWGVDQFLQHVFNYQFSKSMQHAYPCLTDAQADFATDMIFDLVSVETGPVYVVFTVWDIVKFVDKPTPLQ